MENLSNNYTHIKGWGVDANPKNDPTYPMKRYNGDDHKRQNYERPPQQPVTVEVLQTVERPSISAVFGTAVPPSGLSGMIRRYAFKYSENSYGHWVPLILADRVNAIEGIIDDLKHGHIPNIIAERGWKAEWKYDPKRLVRRVVVGVVIATAVVALLSKKDKKKWKGVGGWK